ncbi:MAG: hypothetical protein HQL16_01050 [Candidatus Omnitrophica bacterium]|nr:hypothetical protein [Candidatus Omnitrophota bacterium]
MKKLLIILLFGVFSFLIMQGLGFAAVNHWSFAGYYGGGCYPGVVFDPFVNGRVYLISDVTGVWRSDDAGENWHFINQGLTQMKTSELIVSPSDSNALYLGTEAGLFYSRNAGWTWSKSNTMNGDIVFQRPDNYRSIAVGAKVSDVVCVGTSKGKVFCSSNYGVAWNQIPMNTSYFPPNTPVTAMSYGYNDATLYASSNQGLFQYNFSTNSWKALLQGVAVTDFEATGTSTKTFYVAGKNTIQISRDNGNTWTATSVIPQGTTYRVTVTSAANPVLYVVWQQGGWNGGVISSTDSGKTWVSKDTSISADTALNPTRIWKTAGALTTAVRINPFNQNQLFRTDWWGAYRSDDSGAHWTEKIKGAPNSVGSDLVFTPKGSLYAGMMDNGLLKSDDMGVTYKAVFPIKYDPATAGHVWRVKALADGWITATSTPWNVAYNQTAVSMDSGMTFQTTYGLPTTRPKVNTMWGEGYPRALAMDPKNHWRLYLGIDGDDGGGLFISDDGGWHWTLSSGQPAGKRIYNALDVDINDSNVIYWGSCGANGGIYVSRDQGKTWTRTFTQSLWIFELKSAQNGTVYAVGDYNGGATVFASYNKGTTWSNLGTISTVGTADGLAINPVNPLIISVGTEAWDSSAPQKVFLSRDGGKTWADVTGDLPPGAGISAAVFSNDGQYLFISRYAGGIYKMQI